MIRARDSAFVRKLCGLGIPAQTLAPCLLPAIRALIPSHSAAVFWVDSQGEMINLYAERMLPATVMTMYYERHYQKMSEGFAAAFRRREQTEDPVSFHSFTPKELQSDYFRDVMQPLDAHHILYGILRDGKEATAQISFYRGRSDRAFDNRTADVLRSMLRYLSSGLARPSADDRSPDLSVVVEEDLGMVSPSGEIVSAPVAWSRLVRLAALSQVSPRSATRESEAIQSFLRRICATNGRSDGMVVPVVHDTTWGRFSVRVFPLPEGNGRRPQFGVLIRREEAQSLSLVRGTAHAALSPQQREVALLLAQGKSNQEIATALDLSLNTTGYHVKQVYAKLDVNDRNSVLGKLLELARSYVR